MLTNAKIHNIRNISKKSHYRITIKLLEAYNKEKEEAKLAYSQKVDNIKQVIR